MRVYGLRRRLVLVMLFAFFLGLGGASLFYWVELQELHEDLLRNALRHQAQVTADALAASQVALEDLPAEWEAAYARPDSMVHFNLYDADGQVVLRSANLSAALPIPFGTPFGRVAHGRIGKEDIGFLTVAAGDGRVLQVARGDLSSPGLTEALSEEAVEFVFYTVLPFAIISVVAIWLVVGWSLRPILRASEAAARISPNAPGERIPLDGLPAEIRPLVDAANGALERMVGAFAAVRRLTADAAHELRTPLAALTLRLQRSRLGGPLDWPAIDRELGHLRRLVQQMLVLARRDAPEAEQGGRAPSTINLSRLAREVAALMLPLAEARSRRIEVEAAAPVPVQGYEDELHDMLRNLVENALDHGLGKVTVHATAAADGRALLAVTDEGPGIPPELGDGAFDRFRKGDATSAGAGLGLAIVRRVVERHGGRIRLTSVDRCRIEVEMPSGPAL